jgi:selenocysteine lyase/cysteine desulfurase
MNEMRFPAVMAATTHGRILADNAACSQLPDLALERLQHYLTYDNAQKGGAFTRADATSRIVSEGKRSFADLIGVPETNVGIGMNATSLALTFARLLVDSIRPGDRVVITEADHYANVTPWIWLKRFGAEIDVVHADALGNLDEDELARHLERKPKIVALPWVSNVTGTVFDVMRYARSAKAAGAFVAIDGVQALPHLALDIDPAVDAMMFSAYKMYAPHFGFWYLSDSALERLIRFDDPYLPSDARYWTIEPGTISFEALAGWSGTIAYLKSIAGTPRAAVAQLAAYEAKLAAHGLAKFADRDRVKLYGRPPSESRLPIFAFNVKGLESEELATRFDRAGIEARVGDFYCPRLLRALAPGENSVAVRLSFVHYNTIEEIDRCFDVLDAAIDTTAVTG